MTTDTRMREVLENKLRRVIGERAKDIRETLARIEHECGNIDDYIVPGNQLIFSTNDVNTVRVSAPVFDPRTMNRHAVMQIEERFGKRGGEFADEYFGHDWERALARDRLNAYARHYDKNLLVRCVDTGVRGVLSENYRRFNSQRLFVAFLVAANNLGSVLVDSYIDERRVYLEVIRPEVFTIETPKNGVVHFAYGAQLRHSDFGDGALELRSFKLIPICLNGATGRSLLRQIHLGWKLPDNLALSNETYRKDTELVVSLVEDAMRSLFSTEMIEREKRAIAVASGRDVDFKNEARKLPKLGWMKGEIEALEQKLIVNSSDDGLEGDMTLWKLVQGMTAVARDVDDKNRGRELQQIAGTMLESTVGKEEEETKLFTNE